MNAAVPDHSFSAAGLAALIGFICFFAWLHALVAKRKAPPRRKYFIVLVVILVATAFIPVVDGGAKFGWMPVSLAYVVAPSLIYQTKDDLRSIFLLCYALIAVHQILCIAAAFVLTGRRKNAS